MLKEQNIRCSVIGLAASVHICQKLCRDTQGTAFFTTFTAVSSVPSLLSKHGSLD